MIEPPSFVKHKANPDSKVHGANMRPILGRRDPGGPHMCPMTLLSGKLLLLIKGAFLLRAIDRDLQAFFLSEYHAWPFGCLAS